MPLIDFTKIALKNIRIRKLRAFLTLLGILIAIATIFTLISLSIGLQGAVEEQFRQLGTDKIFIQPRGTIAGPGTVGAVTLTEKDVSVVRKTTGVKDITYWAINSAKIESSNEIRYTFIIGYPLEEAVVFEETGFYVPDEGRLLKKGDQGRVMIGSQYKSGWLKQPLQPGNKILINDVKFEVVGILETVGNPQDDRLIYMSIEDFEELFPDKIDTVDTIIAQLQPGEDPNELAVRIERKLLNSRDLTEKTQDFTILTPEAVLETFGIILNTITAFLLGIAAISLLVGGIGIANTVYTSVLERTPEIGTMKALGAPNSHILQIFLIESGLLGLVGGILGVLLGIAIATGLEYYAINQLQTTILQTAIPTWLILFSLTFAFLAGSLSGLWPAWQATRIKPVDALRYE